MLRLLKHTATCDLTFRRLTLHDQATSDRSCTSSGRRPRKLGHVQPEARVRNSACGNGGHYRFLGRSSWKRSITMDVLCISKELAAKITFEIGRFRLRRRPCNRKSQEIWTSTYLRMYPGICCSPGTRGGLCQYPDGGDVFSAPNYSATLHFMPDRRAPILYLDICLWA
ncbi:hypothetical protein FA95DRAFT_209632 [Auriscalpium vulgare]|uniref:Uncharacterized protein n=1 Tax=Auriscalpium vulgare TaxID=40419 RepID=A0ACB8RLP0_9AGAM|nr:hypothetical protein FA95DRAFT_209632 [Auriscalpium vulgare]